MNDSLDSLVENLTRNLCNTKWKHFMKCKRCKICEKCKYDDIEWCETRKNCKNFKLL